MHSKQTILFILLIVCLTSCPNKARLTPTTNGMKSKKIPETVGVVPDLSKRLPDYISVDAAAPIIDNNDEDEEEDGGVGVDDMNVEGADGAVDPRHDFMRPDFSPDK